jgi:hypothetical protein
MARWDGHKGSQEPHKKLPLAAITMQNLRFMSLNHRINTQQQEPSGAEARLLGLFNVGAEASTPNEYL